MTTPDGGAASRRVLRDRRLRTITAALLVVMPAGARRRLGTWLLGWQVHPTARIGRSLIDAEHVVFGPGAAIGSLNVVRGLERLQLDQQAVIGAMNWISGPPLASPLFPHSPQRVPALIMREGAAITTRHKLDCTDTVTFEPFALMAGIRSTIYTHSIDITLNEQKAQPVTIGERSAVFTNSLILCGIDVPPRSIISAGSVVTKAFTEELSMYGGVPATKVGQLSPTLPFLTRTEPHTD